MIDIAARATRGVKLPTRHATRAHIIQLFKKNLTNLRNCINVCMKLFTSSSAEQMV